MSDHWSEVPEMVEVKDEIVGHRVTTNLRELLRGPRVFAFGQNPRGMKVSIGKGQFIYDLSKKETVYLVQQGTILKIYQQSLIDLDGI